MKDYYPEWLKIAEKLDQLDAQKKKVVVSPVVYKALENSKVELFGVTIQSSPLFPFETHWDACDVSTRQQIQIPSGEWVHGVMMPEITPLQTLWFEESNIEGHKWMCWLDKPIIFKGRVF